MRDVATKVEVARQTLSIKSIEYARMMITWSILIARVVKDRIVKRGGEAIQASTNRLSEQLNSIGTVVVNSGVTDAEVTAILLRPGVTQEELLSVAASAGRASDNPSARAILRKAAADSVPLIDADDFHQFPGSGIHCWVGNVPTLVGSKDFLVRLGIDIDDCATSSGEEVFVAQGSRLLGKIQISNSSRSTARSCGR